MKQVPRVGVMSRKLLNLRVLSILRTISLLLLVSFVVGCGNIPRTLKPKKLASSYLGEVYEKGSVAGSFALSLKQKDDRLTGDFYFQAGGGNGGFFGKVVGRAAEDSVEIQLLVPPYYVREWSMSPVIKLSLSENTETDEELERVRDSVTKQFSPNETVELKVSGAKTELLSGTAELKYFNDEQRFECRFLNLDPPENLFNKP